jgi:hypothetical protein
VLIIPGISIAEVAITNARPAAFPDAERDVLLLQDADHARDSDVVEVRIGRVAEEASAAGIPDGRGERFTTERIRLAAKLSAKQLRQMREPFGACSRFACSALSVRA